MVVEGSPSGAAARFTAGLTLIASFAGALACGTPREDGAQIAASPTPSAGRLLGIDVSSAEGEEYDQAFKLARQTGMQFTSLSIAWDEIETRPGEFAPDPNWLSIANSYYPAQGVPLALTITPIDTNRFRLPDDLAGRAFDDPLVIARFERLLDYVFTQLPDVELCVLSIGNEVDAALGSDGGAWERYRTFFQASAAYARRLRPGLPVGVKVTMAGLTGEARSRAQALNTGADLVLVTYYPLDSDFGVRSPDVVQADLAELVSLYPDRVIGILEAGYPSSALLGSSEAMQAEFVRQIFGAWDSQATQIAMLNFTWLTDAPGSSVEAWKEYYGLDDPRFAAYLATLGLRLSDGTPKLALGALDAEAHARGR